tara:strand:- start:5771 stop:6859 length:1089 start_codon:yes stop_codon:yes gene_type:complete
VTSENQIIFFKAMSKVQSGQALDEIPVFSPIERSGFIDFLERNELAEVFFEIFKETNLFENEGWKFLQDLAERTRKTREVLDVEVEKVISLISDASIPMIIYGGFDLAKIYYPNEYSLRWMRPLTEARIVVTREDQNEVLRILGQCGFRSLDEQQNQNNSYSLYRRFSRSTILVERKISFLEGEIIDRRHFFNYPREQLTGSSPKIRILSSEDIFLDRILNLVDENLRFNWIFLSDLFYVLKRDSLRTDILFSKLKEYGALSVTIVALEFLIQFWNLETASHLKNNLLGQMSSLKRSILKSNLNLEKWIIDLQFDHRSRSHQRWILSDYPVKSFFTRTLGTRSSEFGNSNRRSGVVPLKVQL